MPPREKAPLTFDVTKAVGDRLRAARISKNWSAREVARRAGFHGDATYGRMERGYVETSLGRAPNRPSPESVVRVAAVLGMDGDAICRELGLEPPPPRPGDTAEVSIGAIREEWAAIQQRMDDLLRRLPTSDQSE